MQLIAEIGKQHFGNIKLAKEIIKECSLLGFDAVKFQAYDKKDLVEGHQNYERYVKCHLDIEHLQELQEYAMSYSIDFYTSVFSENLIQPLSAFTNAIKVPSTFFTWDKFVKKCLDVFPEVHISTGFQPFDVIKRFKRRYNRKGKTVVFYNCTSLYPTPNNLLRLSRIPRLGLQGLSYHGKNIDAIIYSMLLGVSHVELHYSNIAPNKWEWSATDITELKSKIAELGKMMKDMEMHPDEESGFKFYKSEYRGLSNA